ncbi:hypothetical protein FOHLNKBM_3238 [Methylobacterium longum]|nr:hypothetical protein FOHLNKBM_3238 [Methylobacterium longum]
MAQTRHSQTAAAREVAEDTAPTPGQESRGRRRAAKL